MIDFILGLSLREDRTGNRDRNREAGTEAHCGGALLAGLLSMACGTQPLAQGGGAAHGGLALPHRC